MFSLGLPTSCLLFLMMSHILSNVAAALKFPLTYFYCIATGIIAFNTLFTFLLM